MSMRVSDIINNFTIDKKLVNGILNCRERTKIGYLFSNFKFSKTLVISSLFQFFIISFNVSEKF